jgi:cyclase
VPEDTEIYASLAAAQEIEEVTPSVLQTLMQTPLGPGVDWSKQLAFGAYRFDDIQLRVPSTTLSDRLSLEIDDRAVDLVEVGPAHSAGDVIVHIPDSAIVTVDALYREWDPGQPSADPVEMFRRMGRYRREQL